MTQIRGGFPLLVDLTSRGGSIKLLGLSEGEAGTRLRTELPGFARAFRKRGIFARTTFIEEAEPGQGLVAAMQALDGAFFRPNCVFLRLPLEGEAVHEEEVRRVVRRARRMGIGILLFADHPEARLGRRQSVNVWVRDQSPDWEISMRLGNLDVSLLIGHILARAWEGDMNVISVVDNAEQLGPAREFLQTVADLARLPEARIVVREGQLEEQLTRVPTADLDVFGLSGEIDFGFARRVLAATGSSCLFVRDSGDENVLA